MQIVKEVKYSLPEDDILLHVETARDSTKQLLELINNFSKVGYKINM